MRCLTKTSLLVLWCLLQTSSSCAQKNLVGHQCLVNSLAFSPDGKLLATAGGDFAKQFGEIKIWDTQTGKEFNTWKGHENAVALVAFFRDGKTLLSANTNGTVQYWQVKTGKVLARFKGHKEVVVRARLTRDRQTLALMGPYGKINVWDLPSKRLLCTLQSSLHGHTYALCFHPDNKTLAWTGRDGLIRFWDVRTGHRKTLFPNQPTPRAGIGLAFDRTGRMLASVHYDSVIRVWEVASRKIRRRFHYAECPAPQICFSPKAEFLALTHADRKIYLWNVRTNQRKTILPIGTSSPLLVQFGPQGRFLASTHTDNTIRLWDFQKVK